MGEAGAERVDNRPGIFSNRWMAASCLRAQSYLLFPLQDTGQWWRLGWEGICKGTAIAFLLRCCVEVGFSTQDGHSMAIPD